MIAEEDINNNMTELIRKFLWFSCNAEGLRDSGTLKGITLLDAITKELEEKGRCIYWNNKCNGCEELLSFEDQAKQVLWSIEESFISDEDHFQISIIDITNSDQTFIIYPKNLRPFKFDSTIVGIKYIIKSWIPTDSEEPEIFDSMESAESELNNLQLMQPENRYEIHEVNSDSE